MVKKIGSDGPLSSLELLELDRNFPGLSEEVKKLRLRVSHGISNIELQEFAALARENRNLIGDEKSALDIARFLGEGLQIAQWKKGDFYGERKALSTPDPVGMEKLKKYVQLMTGEYSDEKNGYAYNHPRYLQLSIGVQAALFGQQNMEKAYARMSQVAKGYNGFLGLTTTPDKRRAILKEQIDLDVPENWQQLIGKRFDNYPKRDYEVVIGSLARANTGYYWHFDHSGAEVIASGTGDGALCLLA